MTAGKVLCLLVVVVAVATAQVVAPPVSAELSAAQQTANRLRKVWTGKDVALLRRIRSVEERASSEDASQMLARLNNKYGVYDRYYDATAGQKRQDEPHFTATISGASPVQEDYRTFYQSLDKKNFDPTKDNPQNLQTMLGAMWGKRYGYMSEAERNDALRKEQMLVIHATPPHVARLSQARSSDHSVNKWISFADNVEELPKAPPGPPKFKPKSYWYGPRVMAEAIDSTHEKLSARGREPSAPPKPPGESFVFADVKTATDKDNPITIIESITVSKPGVRGKKPPKKAEQTFAPIMTKDGIVGPSQKAFIMPL